MFEKHLLFICKHEIVLSHLTGSVCYLLLGVYTESYQILPAVYSMLSLVRCEVLKMLDGNIIFNAMSLTSSVVFFQSRF